MHLARRVLALVLVASLLLLMAFSCDSCNETFATRRLFRTHKSRVHRHPKPKAEVHRVFYHPLLNGTQLHFVVLL